MINIGAHKFGVSPHHAQQVDAPGGCSHPVQPVDCLLYVILGNTNMLEWVHTTYKHQNDLLHACTGTNTANLSKPTDCMNCSITSTLPKNLARYKQVVRPHRRLQLVTVYKKVYFGVKTIAPPPSKPAVVFSLNEGGNKITLLDVF